MMMMIIIIILILILIRPSSHTLVSMVVSTTPPGAFGHWQVGTALMAPLTLTTSRRRDFVDVCASLGNGAAGGEPTNRYIYGKYHGDIMGILSKYSVYIYIYI